MDAGSRVALTTHYTQLKELAARDDRFGVSAMQFVDGRPTYRLIKGAVGESFALQVKVELLRNRSESMEGMLRGGWLVGWLLWALQ